MIFQLGDRVFGLPHVPFDVFAWLTRILPGPLITFGIDSMVDLLLALGLDVSKTAKTSEHLMAYGIVVALGAAAAAVFFLVMPLLAKARGLVAGLALGMALGIAAAVVSGMINNTATVGPAIAAIWAVSAFAIWGLVLGSVWQRLHRAAGAPVSAEVRQEVEQLDRRRFLIRLGAASAVITVTGAGLDLLADRRNAATSGEAGTSGVPAAGRASEAMAKRRSANLVEPPPGTRPEMTAVEDHYLIDINPRPPAVDVETWRLPISGLVDSPTEFTLDDIRNDFEPVERWVTLSCISNRLAGDLIGTTKWTGASLQALLDEVGVQDEATHIEIKSVDGYHETVDLDLVREEPRIMLAYDWDDMPLTRAHGSPLRIWIPDRFGMKQPRWISSIELTSEDRPGYWVERGWDKEAIVKTTSVIDVVSAVTTGPDGADIVPVGGMAYSGARGISRVELRVDGGEWQPAEIREPLSDTTWVLWRFDWPFASGKHTFEVRCFEADGTEQILKMAEHRPSGATGIHSVTKDL
jgi:DMSO/TMAO reductase YedYZ molybdopterin-dependent catalytic subunit